MKKKLFSVWDCSYCGKNHNWVQDPCWPMLDFWEQPGPNGELSIKQCAKNAIRRIKRRKSKKNINHYD